MYNNYNNQQSGRDNRDNRDFNRSDGPRQMFSAVCSKCGKDCEVPFKPSGEKPVFCSNCFERKQEGPGSRSFDNRNFNKPRFEDRDNRPQQNNDQLNAIHAKLDKILSILNANVPTEDVVIPKPQVIEVTAKEEPTVSIEKKKKQAKKAVKTKAKQD